MQTPQAITALAALAQETRLALFRLLVQAGPEGLPASRIAGQLGIAPSLLSFHVRELLQAGLVIQKRAGRFLLYSANFDAMNGLLGYLTDNCCGGNPCSPVSAACDDQACQPPSGK
ncbi:ArsR/SmtB family transcription factor [Noviherbaspirillum aridicola]|uniref:Transcriptional regulator n=1 Tax=Noviherbaspirillum aridicola TaxID=2849687 RepID=A0ABQ4Q7X1_9BURK|nr:metalloregulator ArsR/SmtB family transcription factor [Noviherbaspirillum aridicola]GIZ53091.1 transcriptional regulator [Noviherbaspirillum aridicola]